MGNSRRSPRARPGSRHAGWFFSVSSAVGLSADLRTHRLPAGGASVSCLGGDDSDHDKKRRPHEPGNDTEHKNGPRGAEVTLTRELRFLPSNWDFARDVDY